MAIILTTKKSRKAKTNALNVTYNPTFYFDTPVKSSNDGSYNITTYYMDKVTQNKVNNNEVNIIVHFKKYSLPSISTLHAAQKQYEGLTEFTVTKSVNPNVASPAATYQVDNIDMLNFTFLNNASLQVSLVAPDSDANVPPIVYKEDDLSTYNADAIANLKTLYLKADGSTAESMDQTCSQINSYTCTSSQTPDIDDQQFPGWSVISLVYTVNWSYILYEVPIVVPLPPPVPSICPIPEYNDINGSVTNSLQIVVHRGQFSTDNVAEPLLLPLPGQNDDYTALKGYRNCCGYDLVSFQKKCMNYTTDGNLYVAYTPKPLTLSYYTTIQCSDDSGTNKCPTDIYDTPTCDEGSEENP
ncbi:MAG: hypothetical protein CMM15_13290 [Rhodospirillaceae bacterium]|nr:hypothetical protein [Rhodospirillaceae bacterium]